MWFLGLLAAGALVWAVTREHKVGQGPYDHYPPTFKGMPQTVTPRLEHSSGRWYRVESWPQNAAGETYHIAFLGETPSYVSYLVNTASGRRTFFRGAAVSDGQLAVMKGDFNL